MKIVGIDPGPVHSGLVVFDTDLRCVTESHAEMENADIERRMGLLVPTLDGDWCVCEDVVFYGPDVFPGKSTFDTCKQIGRVWKTWGRDNRWAFINRREVKERLCGNARAKDPQVNETLRLRIGERGTTKNPGPTHGVAGHAWSALAVVVTWLDLNGIQTRNVP